MKLADFIEREREPILEQWEVFARSIWPREAASSNELRNHAGDLLRAIAEDMRAPQDPAEQARKSEGRGDTGMAGRALSEASHMHSRFRAGSGLDLKAVIAEYRALRATVVRLWNDGGGRRCSQEIAELTRFNEAVDQLLTVSIAAFTEWVDQSRQLLLGMVGHDLRTPLNAIQLTAQSLREECDPGSEVAVLAGQILSSSQAMETMLCDLLDVTRIGLGCPLPIAPDTCDLANVIQEVVTEAKAVHPGRAVRVDTPQPVEGVWDGARLRQLLSNLLGNAIEHGADDRPVQVRAAYGNNGYALVAVHNEGPGIPEDLLPRIFDPMVQGGTDGAVKKGRPGSMGLGLFIAREIARAHRGGIEVASSPADGTTFTVRLPCRGPA